MLPQPYRADLICLIRNRRNIADQWVDRAKQLLLSAILLPHEHNGAAWIAGVCVHPMLNRDGALLPPCDGRVAIFGKFRSGMARDPLSGPATPKAGRRGRIELSRTEW
jgi:hypothetical protein